MIYNQNCICTDHVHSIHIYQSSQTNKINFVCATFISSLMYALYQIVYGIYKLDLLEPLQRNSNCMYISRIGRLWIVDVYMLHIKSVRVQEENPVLLRLHWRCIGTYGEMYYLFCGKLETISAGFIWVDGITGIQQLICASLSFFPTFLLSVSRISYCNFNMVWRFIFCLRYVNDGSNALHSRPSMGNL